MIIAVQGTVYGNNQSVKVLNALAVMGVHKDKKSTLILQFGDRSRKSVEQYLIGSTLANESLVQDQSVPDVSIGMDALCAHPATQQFTKDIFSETSRPLVVSNVKNVFDVVVSSRKESFGQEMLNKNKKALEDEVDYFQALLEAADKIYDMVYVLLPSKNIALCRQILEQVNTNIICINQGKKEPVNHGGKRELYVVTDYCSGSVFNSKTLSQTYNQKTVYGCMHNIGYNDACANGTALKFLNENMQAQPKDANYNFIHNIELLYNTLVHKVGKKKEEADLQGLKEYDALKFIQTWEPFTERPITEISVSGTFKKVTTTNTKLVSEDSNVEIVKPEVTTDNDKVLQDLEKLADEEDTFTPEAPKKNERPIFGKKNKKKNKNAQASNAEGSDEDDKWTIT
ncbi:hypothetical protein bpr_II279 (plasmid) [Butyrivibrio proteoclasticus B316]|uniref:Uncharacterized protein n=1 Tax=Butyrivibrio proteoclasticus (strain ATCC 51982 / DSM 14932 / B316) TaxID=515622 RepID=E0S484_BUTPB|nr:hypothetical protein [Butyrivibrio proteoclasticus]ADL36216.1 hypothetical protein bpr_II279 [Butyrivibrio proteoclasticus B316]